MIPYLLLYKILQLAVFMMFGFILVKLNVIKSADSKALSKISLYLLMPCAIINSFDVEVTGDIINGLLLSFAFSFLIHIILLVIDFILKKLFKFTGPQRASVMYSNAANLIIPIVSFVLGDKWVIYSCAFMSVQLVFLWTHGVNLFSKSEKFDIKKIILNINIIAILFGVVMMLSGFHLPKFTKEIVSSLGSMLGTIAMIIAGMMATEVNFKKILKNKRLYLVIIMRLIICPLIVLLVIKSLYTYIPVKNAKNILLIPYLASITPCAATLMQFSKLYDKEQDLTVAINILTTIVCIITMPIFVALYVA